MIKAVLYDFDGTLCNTNQLILDSWNAVFEYTGIRHTREEVLESFGEPLLETLERWYGPRRDECLDVYRDYQKDLFAETITLYPGVKETLKELKKRGYKLALVSSRLRIGINQAMQKLDMEDWDFVLSGDEGIKHKPDPEPCLLAVAHLGVKPEEAIMVGDTMFDLLCAKNAGAHTALVSWSVALAGKKPAEADYVLDRMEGILDILEEVNGRTEI